ncbi:thioredoxin, putative [Fulvivirga imtechensis AK7]|uniref:Thioredoxin, putative n=1 Tax=Fulvivirga imtechensis AK7 TaxID=1237149 RepID=L8JRP7_9BACT|nr:TlpA disulfide reductase family protein [Fulvivirga imtechensis]ELR71641.1 thioredoxin, putative [Fulvivirga imtechensis AK7]
MTKKVKKKFIEYGVTGTLLLTLFLTGLHTEIFGFIQRGVLASGAFQPDVEETSPGVENTNPKADFSMSLINSKGETVSMEEFRGKVIFMNLWATWCPPCIAEMPGINDLHNSIKDDDIVFIMLSLDQSFDKAKQFKVKKGFDFEVYRPAGGIPEMYYSQSIPTTYVIDAKGGLALTHTGMADYNTDEFRAFLKKLK